MLQQFLQMRKITAETFRAPDGNKAEAAACFFPPGPSAPSITPSCHMWTGSLHRSPARGAFCPEKGSTDPVSEHHRFSQIRKAQHPHSPWYLHTLLHLTPKVMH